MGTGKLTAGKHFRLRMHVYEARQRHSRLKSRPGFEIGNK